MPADGPTTRGWPQLSGVPLYETPLGRHGEERSEGVLGRADARDTVRGYMVEMEREGSATPRAVRLLSWEQ
jgi:hypothetical protein